jgi:hypothetical protein
MRMHRELFPPEHGRNGPEPADGNSPLRQILAAPGDDAGPLACGTKANSNVLAGILAGRSTGAAASSRYTVARTSRLYRLQRARGRPWQSGPPESAHCPGRLSPTRPESHSRLSSPFSGIPAVSVFRGRPARGRVRPAAVIRAGAGVQGRRLGPRRGMIDTARIRGRPPRSDLICHAGRRGHQLPDISSSFALK